MYSDTKTTRSVADAVNKILNPQMISEETKPCPKCGKVHEGECEMTEELKGGQVKIDKNHNGKIDGQDFKILRGQKKANEEVQEEKVEPILEYETDKNGKFVHNAKAGRYGGSEKPQDPFAGVRGPGQKDLAKIEAEKKKKKFSEMVNLYQEKGLKSLSEMTKKEESIEEGASEAQWNDQVKVAEFKANTKDDDTVRAVKKKTTAVATPLEVGVKQTNVNYEETEVVDYPLDVDAINGTSVETIEEREMTGSEMEKRETIVKSMKKGMQGFKDRYGDRAKNVMYATATKQAMKEDVGVLDEARNNAKYLENMKHPDYDKHYQSGEKHMKEPMGDESYVDNARTRKKEELKKNPHKKGTMEHQAWHHGASNEADYHIDSLK